jgi:hypothetical protein
MNTTTSSKSEPGWWRRNVVLLALLAALFAAFMSVLDTLVILKPFLGVDTLPDGYVLTGEELRTNVFAYLLLGSWVGVVTNLVFNRTFGKTLQPDFRRERFVSIKAQVPVFITGLLAAVFTFTQIFVATSGDPSYLIALSNFAIVYIVLFEGFGKRDLPAKLVLGVVALVGSVLVSLENIDSALSFRWNTLFLMVVVVGVTMAVSRLIEREHTDRLGGGVNFAFWRFLWLAVVSSVAAPIIAAMSGTLPQFINVLATKSLGALPYVAITMFFAYGTNLLRIAAQRLGGEYNTSRVSIILASCVVFAVPLTFLAKYTFPNVYTIPEGPGIWLLRGLGTILIAFSIVRLERLKE